MMGSTVQSLTISHMAFGGDGVATDSDGQTVFVPYALPGETVTVQIKTDQGRRWGKIIEVPGPSPDRIDPPLCGHCFDCGGCALQHWQLSAYRAWKYQTVQDRLTKAGLTPATLHPMISVPAGTRRRATFAARRLRGRVVLGFNRHHSDQIVDIQECHVVMPALMTALPGLRHLLDVLLLDTPIADVAVTKLDHGLDVLVTAPIDLNLVMREAIAEFVQQHRVVRFSIRSHERAEIEVILNPGPTSLLVGGQAIVPPPGSFLQPSLGGEEALIACVLAGVGGATRVADLFCGLGTFTYPIVRTGAQVQGFDVAVLPKNPLFTSRNLYRDPLTVQELAVYDAVVLDPPRAGAKGQMAPLAASHVPVVVSVSCNPASFVTDGLILRSAGYQLTDVWVVDQFIWSAHVEMVGVFKKDGTA